MNMNHCDYRKIAVKLSAAVACALLAGCSTPSGYQLADKTGKSMAEFRQQTIAMKQAVDGTVKALDQISETASTNPRSAYEQFVKAVDKLASASASARKSGQEMTERGQAYFSQWQQEMAQVQNADIRQLAEQQKAKIKKLTVPLHTQFDTWMTDLQGLKSYLGNDLTVTGVNAAKNLFQKSQAEGMDVQKSLEALEAELNTVAATITPANVPPNQKQGGS